MSESAAYLIQRVISNNAILVSIEKSDSELVLMGKGLGFGAKAGMLVLPSDPRIEKKFNLAGSDSRNQFKALTEQVDPKVLDVSQEIISMVGDEFDTSLNEQIFIALPSHIQFALYRLENNIDIANPFIYEIQALHSREFALAKKAAVLIEKKFNIEIPETEVGFLAMHIQSAVCHISVGNIVKWTHLIQEAVAMIEAERGFKVPRDSLDYIRLITHLRFAIERLTVGQKSPNPFANQLRETLKDEYTLGKKIALMMEANLGVTVSEDEIGYLVMHLYRLFQHYGNPTL
ncbi:transcription antiterminator [Paenibacillus terrigena]|uniref:transcription antiterminator n=1 Tax=Paenibacillus terrigena TaxID=369333 RepID=UPI0028D747DB|nr:transcription antiterminator [Paenibacillus terrigena]